MIVAARALLDRSPNASREEIVEGLAGHVCRCTGYVKIVEAVDAAARGDVADTARHVWPEPGEPEIMVPGSPA